MPILADFHQWLQGQAVDVLAKSKISEAVSYALNQWDAWVRYFEAGCQGYRTRACAIKV